MNQQEFNLTHPISHRTDPETSKAAERSITDSGVRKTHNEQVAWLVARHPGKTASEYAYWYADDAGYYHLDLIEIRRRLSDMNGIHVRRGDKSEARIGLLKNRESVWYPR